MSASRTVQDPPGVELFKEDYAENVKIVSDNLSALETSADQSFAQSMVDFYDQNGYLTPRQLEYMVKFWHYINERL